MTTDLKRRISNSELETFRRCRRKWYLSSHRSLEPKKQTLGGALSIGTWVHDAMRAYYNMEGEMGEAKAIERLIEIRAEQPRDEEGNEYPEVVKAWKMADAVVTGYMEWIAETGYDADFEVVATEIALQAPSPIDGVDLIGKLDLLGMRKNSKVYRIRDFKTVPNLTAPVKTLHLVRQMKLYHLLLKLTHPEWPTDGTEWVMMRKVLRSATANPPFYGSYEIHHNDDELRVFWTQLHGEISVLLDAERRLLAGEDHQHVVPPNPRPECSYDCPFLAVCGPMDDPRSDAEYLIGENYQYHDSLSRYERDPDE